jgi:hypothetical protein
VRSWSTFGARTSHRQHKHTILTTARTGGSHHLPPYSILWTSGPLHGAHIQMAFLSQDSRVGVPKLRQQGGVSKLRQWGLPRLWSPITLRSDLGSRCGLKQSRSSCQELSNGMLHIVYNQVNRVDSPLFRVGSQIDFFHPDPSFGHNLCFRCPNEQCELILDI